MVELLQRVVQEVIVLSFPGIVLLFAQSSFQDNYLQNILYFVCSISHNVCDDALFCNQSYRMFSVVLSDAHPAETTFDRYSTAVFLLVL